MRWAILTTTLPLLLLTAGIRDASACSCMPSGPPCQNYFASDVVFVGTVRSITPVPGAHFMANVRVEFDNAVASRGFQGTSVTVFTADNGAACGYAFRPGERYVVYARRSSATTTQIVTSICSRTRPISEASEDLKFFESVSTLAFAPRVFGSISHWDRDPVTGDPRNAGPVGKVVLTLSSSGSSFQVQTGQDGRYEFSGVPPGQYLLMGVAPPLFSSASLKASFELPDTRACHQADFVIPYDSRVIGSIVDAEGRPVANAHVEITPVDKIGSVFYMPSKIASSDLGGHFELAEVLPDRYILGVNLAQGPDDVVASTRYHPNATDPDQATVFEIRPGERVTLDQMVISPASRAYTVTGRITFPDGKPAGGVAVSLEDGHQKWKRVAAEVQTGADGSFSFVVHDGLAYIANARYENPLVPGRTQATASHRFVASEGNVKTLELVLVPVRR